MSQKAEAFQRLVEIREEIDELIHEAADLVRSEFRSDYANADSYWIPHIKSALGSDNYPTYSPTFQSFLESNEEEAFEEEDEDEDFNSVGSRHHY